MKKSLIINLFLLTLILFSMSHLNAQNSGAATTQNSPELKTYLIERDIPGAGLMPDTVLKVISQKSCAVLKEMGTGIVWVQSYVTGNKIFCVYRAEKEELLREHAKKGGFPITYITQINNIISPKTAE